VTGTKDAANVHGSFRSHDGIWNEKVMGGIVGKGEAVQWPLRNGHALAQDLGI
jgi:hypothetical protein